MAVVARRSAPSSWLHALKTCGCGREPDVLTRWLVITRACVLPMTLTSIAIAGFLAAEASAFEPLAFALGAIGLILAHSANNMINDFFDLEAGLDTADYPRTLYAPHPVASGLVTRRGLLNAIVAVNVTDAAIMLTLFLWRGWPVIAFALAGLFISVFYVAPPLRLKARGLGEPGVFLVWGPLMIGGLFYASTGEVTGPVIASSIPYALLVTTVLMGKHIDKMPWDEAAGVGTLPVQMGEAASRAFTRGLIVAFYVSIAALIAAGWLSLWLVVIAIGFPLVLRTWRTLSQPKPTQPPDGYGMWPLWFAAWCFVHARQAGALLVCGLLLNAIWPFSL